MLIGVQKAHTLPELQAVLAGVQGMNDWAVSQAIDVIKTITDERQKVTPEDISATVRGFCDDGTFDQLLIYFAGHGVVVGYAEYWLLSNGIVDANAAVNLKGSAELARRGVIPHVVFISDACRTAAQSIQAQGIAGSLIFPNRAPAGQGKQVDVFYATLIGDPALEIADPKVAAAGFKAVYTDALLEALSGQHPDIAEPDTQQQVNVIRPWPLHGFLTKTLPLRVFQATFGVNPRNQEPDAVITSRPTAWIATIPPQAHGTPPARFDTPPTLEAMNHAREAEAAIRSPDFVTQEILMGAAKDVEQIILRQLLSSSSYTLGSAHGAIRADLDDFSGRNRRFKREALRNGTPFGPEQFETQCGFKLRGAHVTAAIGTNAVEVLDGGALLKINLAEGSVRDVLIVLREGSGVLLPAIHGFLASLTFDNGRLDDVAYEPSHNSQRWVDYRDRADELRSLRAVIASSSRLGRFRVDQENANVLARRMQLSYGVDISLALYAAHAYRDQGNDQRLNELAQSFERDLQFVPFDIALLAGRPISTDKSAVPLTYPFLPVLSKSWALLPTADYRLPEKLHDIHKHSLPNSLWTVFDADGVRLISQFIHDGVVK